MFEVYVEVFVGELVYDQLTAMICCLVGDNTCYLILGYNSTGSSGLSI